MKIEELQIGDWYTWDAEGKMYPLQIKREDFALYDDDIINFKPIPLTPEILEKNGFGFCDMSSNGSAWTGWWILDCLELGCCSKLNFPVYFNIADTNVKVNYVHELQHALRLCKIDKEIIL